MQKGSSLVPLYFFSALPTREQSSPGWLSAEGSNETAQCGVLQKEMQVLEAAQSQPARQLCLRERYASKPGLPERNGGGCCCSGFGNDYVIATLGLPLEPCKGAL